MQRSKPKEAPLDERAGVHLFPGIQKQLAWTRAGGNLIMHSSDTTTFRQQLASNLAALRSALGDSWR